MKQDRSVLIVDDDPTMCRMLVDRLEEVGWRAAVALGVEEALARVGDEPYAVVLSDIQMGERDGWDLLRRLRERHSAPPVILMSSFGSTATAMRAREEGAFDYLSKPFDMAELLALLERLP